MSWSGNEPGEPSLRQGVRAILLSLSLILLASLKLLERLVSLRQDLAESLGFASYSHLSAWQRVLKEPQQVQAFLSVPAYIANLIRLLLVGLNRF